MRRLLVPNLPVALALALFLVCTVTPFSSSLISADGDLALHVTHGELILDAGRLLGEEPTTFAEPGKPFVAHEWLVQLSLGLAHRACGLAGPVLLAAGLGALIFGGLLGWLRRLSVGPWPAIAVTLLALLVARIHLLARPHLITWALALLWTVELERFRRGELSLLRWLGVAFALIVIWVNAHGAFLFAFLLLGLYGLGELITALRSRDAARGEASLRFGQLFVGGLLLLLASGINPWGFHLHAHVISHVLTPAKSFQAEFLPLDPSKPGQLWVVVWAALALLSLLAGPRRARPTEWLLTLALGALAFRSARQAPLFALLTAPLVAERLQAILDAARAPALRELQASSERLDALERAHGGWLTAAVVLLFVTVAVGFVGVPPVRFDRQRLPVEAVRYVQEHADELPPLGGDSYRVWSTYRWSGYVSYVLHPGHRNFVNSFADHFSVETLDTYKRVRRLEPGWELELRRFDWFLVEEGNPLASALVRHPRWRHLWSDALAHVFVRRR